LITGLTIADYNTDDTCWSLATDHFHQCWGSSGNGPMCR